MNLYDLRRAIAALVWARHNLTDPAELEPRQLVLVDDAVNHLSAAQTELHGELAAATRSLLSREPDVGGRRTVRAIDRLGELAHVDADSAEAIASLRPASTALDAAEPLRLFDPDDGIAS